MAQNPGTNRQVPEHSIMDHFDKQNYLGNTFAVPLSLSLSNTSETPLLLIQNPAVVGSGFPSGYKGLFIKNKQVTCAGQVTLRCYLNPTVSSTGTASSIFNLRSASPNASIALPFANGQFSVSANGSLVDVRSAVAGAQALSDLLLILDPGKSLLITIQTVTSGTNAVVGSMSWDEI